MATPTVVVNLQGDLPTLDPALVKACLAPLTVKGVDIATLAAEIAVENEKTNPNVVKVVGTPLDKPGHLRALYFTRATAPYGEGPLYHHIGIYAYRRAEPGTVRGLEALAAWNCARSWSSCARWKPACASTSLSSTRFPSVSTRPTISSAPAASWRRPETARHLKRYGPRPGKTDRSCQTQRNPTAPRALPIRASRGRTRISPAVEAFPDLEAAAYPTFEDALAAVKIGRGAPMP